MTGHFKKFKAAVVDTASQIIKAALNLHFAVTGQFKKTAVNFHYEFNIRHLTNIFEGMLRATATQFQEGEKLTKLFIHEAERT